MKKIYIVPVNKLYNVSTREGLLTVQSTSTVQSGGSNKNPGAPIVAETREEASWSSDEAWEEW